MSASTMQARMTSAVTAIDAGDYDTALKHLLAAKALLIALPNANRGWTRLEWDKSAIDKLIDECRRQKQVASRPSLGMVQQQKIKYVEPEE